MRKISEKIYYVNGFNLLSGSVMNVLNMSGEVFTQLISYRHLYLTIFSNMLWRTARNLRGIYTRCLEEESYRQAMWGRVGFSLLI